MRLSWNEIRTRAADFAREWADFAYEKGETQSFTFRDQDPVNIEASELMARPHDAFKASGYDLRRFRDKLGTLRLFDPACGCGDFLIIAYRELRTLEIDVLREIVSGLPIDRQCNLLTNKTLTPP